MQLYGYIFYNKTAGIFNDIIVKYACIV